MTKIINILEFVIVDTEEDADVLFLLRHFKDYKVSYALTHSVSQAGSQ